MPGGESPSSWSQGTGHAIWVPFNPIEDPGPTPAPVAVPTILELRDQIPGGL